MLLDRDGCGRLIRLAGKTRSNSFLLFMPSFLLGNVKEGHGKEIAFYFLDEIHCSRHILLMSLQATEDFQSGLKNVSESCHRSHVVSARLTQRTFSHPR